MAEPRRADVAVIFFDLRGFSRLVDTTEPEYTLEMLDAYYKLADAVARRHGGIVFDTGGDQALLLFNAPTEVPDFELAALHAAVAMRTDFAPFGEHWRRRSEGVTLATGINAGFATLGTIGFPPKYAAIGGVVNTAAHLSGMAGPGQILAGPRIANHPKVDVPVRALEGATVRGHARPVPVFEIAPQG